VKAVASSALLVALACAASPTPPDADAFEAPGELVATQEIAGDFLARQLLRFRFGDQQGALEAVLQKHCDELTLVGLTPFGTPAFAIRQRGLEVRVESSLPGPWPFSPRRVLADVHRIYFLPQAERAPADGVHRARLGGETVSERWAGGRLLERSFESATGDPPGRIVVRYPGGADRGAATREVHLTNERHGYEIDVTTLSWKALACPREAEGDAVADRSKGPR